MQIKGPKRLVKRAVFMAVALDLFDVNIRIKWGKTSWMETIPDGFLISVARETPKYYLSETVAHEMVHVRQYVVGDLVDCTDGTTLWKGVVYETGEIGSDSYYLSPWEIEARGMQEWLDIKWRTRVVH